MSVTRYLQGCARPYVAQLLASEVKSVRLPKGVVKVTDALTLLEADAPSLAIVALR